MTSRSSSSSLDPIAPGSIIGIIGGGQLGRMTALAAASLGYKCHIYCPEPQSPGKQVSAYQTTADYTDEAALRAFADQVDVVTFEFENIPHESVRLLTQKVPVRPNWECLHVAQDRLREKDFINDLGIATAPYMAVTSADTLEKAVDTIGRPAVLKTSSFGYDGKGQVKIEKDTDLNSAWTRMSQSVHATPQGILEGFISFTREISVVIARGTNGSVKAFDPVENRHTNHILDVTIAPAPISQNLADEARAIAHKIAQGLDLVGLLAVEMFVTAEGKILVNEIAPRPHNSGHWTIDACLSDQFEQFVRAVCGLPLGSNERHHDAVMKNLLGNQANDWAEHLKNPDAKLHLYGKREPRQGRKMGHVTRLYPKGSNPS